MMQQTSKFLQTGKTVMETISTCMNYTRTHNVETGFLYSLNPLFPIPPVIIGNENYIVVPKMDLKGYQCGFFHAHPPLGDDGFYPHTFSPEDLDVAQKIGIKECILGFTSNLNSETYLILKEQPGESFENTLTNAFKNISKGYDAFDIINNKNKQFRVQMQKMVQNKLPIEQIQSALNAFADNEQNELAKLQVIFETAVKKSKIIEVSHNKLFSLLN